MKQGHTLQALVVELERQQRQGVDYFLPVSDLHYTEGRMTIRGTDIVLSSLALEQLLHYLEIPIPFYNRVRKVPSYPEDLAGENINMLLSHYAKTRKNPVRLCRVLDGQVRAFLSDRYDRRLDNLPVWKEFSQVINTGDCFHYGINLESLSVTETHLYSKVTTTKLQGTVLGQVVQGGFCLRNSEVGRGFCEVFLFLKVLSCLNGMCIEKSMGTIHYRHIGKKWKDTEEPIVEEGLQRLHHLQETVETILSGEEFHSLLEQYNTIGREAVTKEELPKFLRSMGLTPEQGETVLARSPLPTVPKWELANRITHLSKEYDYDEATRLEGIGHKVLQ